MNFTDHEGNLWELDRYYSGGRQISDGEIVGGTQDPELFLSQRYGNFSYRFPAPPGKYTLRLLFAETFFGPHNRGKGGAVTSVRPLPENDPRQRRPDITRARKLLGWEPRIPLAEGLKPTVDYFRTELGL